jgi:hypothetical protein
MTKGDIYQVEKLLSHKPQSGDRSKAKSYLVKWENYCVEEATWESVSMLKKSAAATIEEYWSQDSRATSVKSSRRNSASEEKTDEKAEENAVEKADKDTEENTEDKTAEEIAEEIAVEEPENEAEPENLGDEEYIIEEIRDTFPKVATCHAEVKKYLIKWEGYGDDEMTKEPALEIEESASGKIEEFWAKKIETKNVKKSPKIKSPKRKLKIDSETISGEATIKTSKRGRVIKPTSPMQVEPEVKKARVTSTKSAQKVTPPKKTSPASKVENPDVVVLKDMVSTLKERVDELEIQNKPKDRKLLIDLSRRTDLPRSVSVQLKAHLRNNPIQ